MSRIILYLGVLFGTAALSAAGTPLVARIARRSRILDVPDAGRKRHGAPVPLLGGVSIWMTVVAAVAFLFATQWLPDPKITVRAVFGLLIGSTILMVTGYLDDRYRLSPQLQILGPLAAALAVVFSGVQISAVTNPWGGVFIVPAGLIFLLTFGWILGMTYTTKLLDGLDGLVASLTAVGALIIFGVSLAWDAPSTSTALLALALAGSCLGFLPFNASPAKIFLGEGGGLFLGFMLAFLAIASGSKIATALLVMGVPVMDAGWVIVERLRQRSNPVRGDRRHLHYRLLERGLTVRQIVALLAAISAAFGSVALVASSGMKIIALGVLILFVVFLLRWARQPSTRAQRGNGQI